MLDKLRNKGCLVKKFLQLADRFPLYQFAGKSPLAQVLFHHHDGNREETSTYAAALNHI